MTQKTIVNNEQTTTRSEFLATLYADTPDDLWLELRCIHPMTGEVRALWAQSGNEQQREAVLEQADKFNADGFGLYFAPCLRRTRRGNADSAAYIAALWVDVDDKSADALAKLTGFEQPPSAIIDSGGGYHAYWLLAEPLELEFGEQKQKIAAIMDGLFSVTGGDEAYVKSVASVMRLPDSTNTKPDRDGAKVHLIAWHPERRYALADFEWLCRPKTPASTFSTNGNGQHPLPPRTESYLTNGAHNGNRNAELFAAACQMRDAGHDQSDAERQLIPRHVADGNGSESSVSREKEARATIASAYSQPARDPIRTARERVSALVSRYPVEQKADRPTAQQIAEVVEACVHLNAVEWAEERQRLKALCGDGLKISDIDRLYKEKKREQERQRQQEYVDSESYLVADGKIIYRKDSYRGVYEKTVADWMATALYQTCQVDDDGKETHVTHIELKRGASVKKLDVPGEVFVDDVALRRYIGASAGAQYVVRAGMSKHLVPAIVQLSGEFPTHRHYNFMGWMQLDGRWVYVSPGDCITHGGKLAEPPSVELDHRLRDYGLRALSWDDSLAAFSAVMKVLPPHLAPALIAFALLPILQRFFPKAGTRPAIHLVGTSGSGKSEIASLLSSFYGSFSRDMPPAQWGDTVNMVEMLGYPLADALYWVDDYKDIYADTRTFTRFLQSYSRNLGRGRLTREAKVRHEKPCRGLILSTGETSLEGEMSVASRMMSLEIPPWKQRDPEGEALRNAESLRDNLPGFTAHFASWIARQLEGDLIEEIANRFAQNLRGYNQQLSAKLGKNSHHDRAVKNWSVLVTVYQLLSKFLREMDEGYLLPAWQDVIVENVRALREERASEVFLNVLGQLLAGGQAILDDDMRHPRESHSATTVIGYRHEGFIYLLPDVALREVNKIQPLKFSATAIGMQLKEDDLLIPGKTNLSVQKSVRGSVVRLWRLKSEVLGCEGCETCEADD